MEVFESAEILYTRLEIIIHFKMFITQPFTLYSPSLGVDNDMDKVLNNLFYLSKVRYRMEIFELQ